MSWIKRPIHRFKYKFSEPYRISIGVGVSPLRNNREYNALIKFCRKELEDKEHMKLNPERWKIYAATILLHEQGQSNKSVIYTRTHKFQLTPNHPVQYYNDANEFINDHIGWYWN